MNYMLKLKLLPFVLICISCNNTSCPSFPKVLNKYIPYKPDQILTFTDKSDTIKFKIIWYSITGEYEIKYPPEPTPLSLDFNE